MNRDRTGSKLSEILGTDMDVKDIDKSNLRPSTMFQS